MSSSAAVMVGGLRLDYRYSKWSRVEARPDEGRLALVDAERLRLQSGRQRSFVYE